MFALPIRSRAPWRTPGIVLGFLGVLVLGAWLIVAVRWEATASRLRETLPDQIGVGKLVAEGDDIPFICYLIALCREVCGGFAFRLTDETVAGLMTNGIRQLDGAVVSRGGRDIRLDNDLYRFEPWQQTPVPTSWTSEGWLYGLQCWDDRNLDKAAITQAAAAPGSYFTTGSRRSTLLVIPSLGLAVFLYGP